MDAPKLGPALNIFGVPCGKNGDVAVTVRLDNGAPFTDRVSITKAAKRAEFLDALMTMYPGLPRDQVEAQLERIAAQVINNPNNGLIKHQDSQATRLVAMVEAEPSLELFHTPGGDHSEGYVSFTVDGHRETLSINSQAFERWLSALFHRQERTVPSSQAMSAVANVLTGKAIHDGPEHAVHIRMAEQGDAIWLDLADEKWRAVKITAAGWQLVESDIPVRFIRKKGMLPLPAPEHGGSIGLLRTVLNLREEFQWILVVSWLVAALRPNRPFTILNVNGEQGSAKTTLCKMLRCLIDPAKPLLRRPPKGDHDLMIAANNSGIVAFDNISGLSADLSDSLCSLATGGGFAARKLYSNDEEQLFDAIRPVLINGIDDSAIRPDLLDRSVNIYLSRIADEQRRDEDTLWREFDGIRPRVLGALLKAVATGLRNLATTKLAAKPRMADFALFISAAEPSLPWKAGAFIRAYRANRQEAHCLAIESSAIADPILTLLDETTPWQGTAGELMSKLQAQLAPQRIRLPKDWPPNRKAMGNALRRIAPALRELGVTVVLPQKGTGHNKKRIFRLERSPGSRSARPASSADPPCDAGNGAPAGTDADHPAPIADYSTPPRSAHRADQTPIARAPGPAADRADDADRCAEDPCSGEMPWGSQ